MKEVNLFDSYLKTASLGRKTLRLARTGAVVLLAAYCVLASGIFSYWLMLRQKDRSLETKIENQKSRISAYRETESLHLLIKERLRVLSAEDISSRLDLAKVISETEAILPEGVRLEDLSVGSGGVVVLSGEAKDAFSLDAFLKNLTDFEKNKNGRWIELDKVSRGPEGSYNFSIKKNAN